MTAQRPALADVLAVLTGCGHTPCPGVVVLRAAA